MTAIYDGIMSGLVAARARKTHTPGADRGERRRRQRQPRKARTTVMRRVRESDATIYTVALVDPLVTDGNPGCCVDWHD